MIKSLLTSMGITLGALVLFVGTILAVLNMQGRLNPEGLQGTPLERLYPPEKKAGQERSAREKKDQAPKESEAQKEARKIQEKMARIRTAGASLPDVYALPASVDRAELDRIAARQEEREKELRCREEALARAEEGLAIRERDVEDRKASLKKLMAELDARRKALDEAARKLARDQVILRQGEKKNIKRLADMVSEMKPEDAARTLGSWMPEGEKKIVKVLAAMDPSAAARILGKLQGETAQRLFDLMTRYREEGSK